MRIPAVPATNEMLELVHSKNHIATIKKKEELTNKEGQGCEESTDCYENMYTSKAAYMSAGGTIEAVRAICREKGNDK